MDTVDPVAVPAPFQPRTGTLEEWNLAFVRVEDYLRAHRVQNRLLQIRLIERILERAAERHAADPSREPTVLAAEECAAVMDVWFAEILEEHGLPHERVAIDGRVALLLSDAIERWPFAFLLPPEELPAEFLRAMRARSIRAGPDLTVSSMVPRPIDLGPVTSVAGQTLERFERQPIIRTLFLWALFAAALGIIFRLTR